MGMQALFLLCLMRGEGTKKENKTSRQEERESESESKEGKNLKAEKMERRGIHHRKVTAIRGVARRGALKRGISLFLGLTVANGVIVDWHSPTD